MNALRPKGGGSVTIVTHHPQSPLERARLAAIARAGGAEASVTRPEPVPVLGDPAPIAPASVDPVPDPAAPVAEPAPVAPALGDPALFAPDHFDPAPVDPPPAAPAPSPITFTVTKKQKRLLDHMESGIPMTAREIVARMEGSGVTTVKSRAISCSVGILVKKLAVDYDKNAETYTRNENATYTVKNHSPSGKKRARSQVVAAAAPEIVAAPVAVPAQPPAVQNATHVAVVVPAIASGVSEQSPAIASGPQRGTGDAAPLGSGIDPVLWGICVGSAYKATFG